ncbi:hypothetical protein DITRI_Ditri17bG0109300 [Diplodiscus trichospermus]
MAKSSIFLILALLLLLSAAQSRPLSTSIRQQADDERQNIPFSSPESRLNDDECQGVDGEECLIRRSLAAHTDYIYTQENDAP